jgi:hypothetical protein
MRVPRRLYSNPESSVFPLQFQQVLSLDVSFFGILDIHSGLVPYSIS